MMRYLPLIVLASSAVFVAPSARATDKIALKSVSVDLPNGDRVFADGSGSDAINNNCLVCHSAGMVLNQPNLAKAQWEAEVNKMRTTYKAPVGSKDADAIVNYLVGIKGAK
jgi:cytochrome c5